VVVIDMEPVFVFHFFAGDAAYTAAVALRRRDGIKNFLRDSVPTEVEGLWPRAGLSRARLGCFLVARSARSFETIRRAPVAHKVQQRERLLATGTGSGYRAGRDESSVAVGRV
jgi:hypothetical protein